MTVVEQLDECIRFAERNGIDVRVECLGGTPGGICRLGTQTRLYLDMADSPAEQLEIITKALSELGKLQAESPRQQSGAKAWEPAA